MPLPEEIAPEKIADPVLALSVNDYDGIQEVGPSACNSQNANVAATQFMAFDYGSSRLRVFNGSAAKSRARAKGIESMRRHDDNAHQDACSNYE
ncbi:MAG: hypothetical protein ACREDC_09950 [Bradyrhizobium sp.]